MRGTDHFSGHFDTNFGHFTEPGGVLHPTYDDDKAEDLKVP